MTEPPLRLEATAATGVAGRPLGDEPLPDSIVTADLMLVEGDGADRFGLYVRQSTPERYLAFTLSIDGDVQVIEKDVEVVARITDRLRDDLPFGRGLGATNRMAVVAAGPALVLYVNGAPIVPVLVDPRFSTGFAGAYLRPGGTSGRAALDVAAPAIRALDL